MRINTLILGKSGAGKSTLLNYLYGEKVAKTGVGKPVTQKSDGSQNLLYEYAPISIDKNELTIFDSWGMEADKATEWVKLITEESKKREASGDVEDWFHAVIYCISAAGARIEDFEVYYVIKALQEAGHNVIIALTKTGRASEEERKNLHLAIKAKVLHIDGNIINIESLSETLRDGKKTHAAGRDEIIRKLTGNLENKLRNKFAAQYVAKCESLISKWKFHSLEIFDSKASHLLAMTGGISEEVSRSIINNLSSYIKELEEWQKSMEKKIKDLQESFILTLQYKKNAQKEIKIHTPISIEEIELETSERIIYVIGQVLLPVLSSIVIKDVMRDDLEKKLDIYAKKLMEQAKKAAKSCRESGQFAAA